GRLTRRLHRLPQPNPNSTPVPQAASSARRARSARLCENRPGAYTSTRGPEAQQNAADEPDRGPSSHVNVSQSVIRPPHKTAAPFTPTQPQQHTRPASCLERPKGAFGKALREPTRSVHQYARTGSAAKR